MTTTSGTSQQRLHAFLRSALFGENAHLSPAIATEQLRLDVTGKKILHSPYTIWQILKHCNFWNERWLARLRGEKVRMITILKEGWEDENNARSQEELDSEVKRLLQMLAEASKMMEEEDRVLPNELYPDKYAVIQSMASHMSYHLAQLVMLRKIFLAWPPPSGTYDQIQAGLT